MTELRTARCILREWRDSDRMAFAAINQQAEVVRYLPGPLTRQESDALIDRQLAHFAEHGYGWWAVEIADTGALAGAVGLWNTNFDAWFTPCVEIGWRLGAQHWGQGYASEAARAALHAGFTQFGLDQVVSFTVPANLPSQRVMQRLGMQRDGAFDHPRLPEGHPLRHHVLYRLTRRAWPGG